MKYIKENHNYLIFSFFLVSIASWVAEIGYSLIERNKFVLPGAWYGPYCLIYGLTFLLLLAVFRKEDSVLWNVIKIVITVTVMEYVISFISDELFHNVIWDYTGMFLNINGRVCFKMSLIFTIVGTIGMYILVPITRKIYDKLGDSVKYINAILCIMLIIDIFLTLGTRIAQL